MVVFVRHTVVASCLLLVAGCVTDELVVYQDSTVTKKAMKPFLGMYEVKQWPGNSKPETVRVTKQDGEFRLSYSLQDKKVQSQFVLSKIPNSKKDLYLLSIPRQDGTIQANTFYVGKAEKEQTLIWVVLSKLPVVNGKLEFKNGTAKAEEVKTFLAKNADAFVKANEPQVTLKKENR